MHDLHDQRHLLGGDAEAAGALRQAALPLTGASTDWDALIERIGDARVVMLGESSHGTSEFYAARADITRRLIHECGFSAVAVESDWPDAYRVNRYVRGEGADRDANEALQGFQRFPTWMWRNRDVEAFVDWLHGHNSAHPGQAAGFYGLDLYSLHDSADAVIGYLDRVDPPAAARARRRYGCFEPFTGETQEYGRAVVLGGTRPCHQEALTQLVDLRRRAGAYLLQDGAVAEERQFVAEQNARVVSNAEEYYRTMFADHASSWNLRDRHMADTLDELLVHLERAQGHAKVVVWAHNSHVGDARATQMRDGGELNIGQLVRERHAGDAVLVGFTTATGTVTAAQNWGDVPRRRTVRPPLAGSIEAVFHEVGYPAFLLLGDADPAAAEVLRQRWLHRAIGVIYRPETERQSHYLTSRPGRQFDAIVHLDHTTAVEPLDRREGEALTEPPETYPTAI